MLRENLTALLLLYIRPVAGIGKILDQGRLWFALLAALGVSVAVHIPALIFATEVSTETRAIERRAPARAPRAVRRRNKEMTKREDRGTARSKGDRVLWKAELN